jgi:hypothetical protein
MDGSGTKRSIALRPRSSRRVPPASIQGANSRLAKAAGCIDRKAKHIASRPSANARTARGLAATVRAAGFRRVSAAAGEVRQPQLWLFHWSKPPPLAAVRLVAPSKLTMRLRSKRPRQRRSADRHACDPPEVHTTRVASRELSFRVNVPGPAGPGQARPLPPACIMLKSNGGFGQPGRKGQYQGPRVRIGSLQRWVCKPSVPLWAFSLIGTREVSTMNPTRSLVLAAIGTVRVAASAARVATSPLATIMFGFSRTSAAASRSWPIGAGCTV